MKKLMLVIALALPLLAFGVVLQTAPVHASAFDSSNAADQACAGISGRAASGDCSAPGNSLDVIISRVLNLLSGFIGIAAVIMIMVGGFKYITAGGDASKASSAKSTLIYAVIGVVIVALAQFIVQFVLNEVTKKPPAQSTTQQAQ